MFIAFHLHHIEFRFLCSLNSVNLSKEEIESLFFSLRTLRRCQSPKPIITSKLIPLPSLTYHYEGISKSLSLESVPHCPAAWISAAALSQVFVQRIVHSRAAAPHSYRLLIAAVEGSPSRLRGRNAREIPLGTWAFCLPWGG